MNCPDCKVDWPVTQYGVNTCPNCRTGYVVSRTGAMREYVTRAPQFSYGRKADRLKADIIINGQLLCACCLDAFPPSQMTDARIETEGEQFVRVQAGWHYDSVANTLSPEYDTRRIPRVIRGPTCVRCMVHHHGKAIANADDRLKARQARPIEKLYPRQGPRDGYGFPVIVPGADLVYTRPEGDESGEHMVEWRHKLDDRDYLDPDPTWAHTGDPTWISPKMLVNVRYPQGLNTGYWTRDDESKRRAKSGSMKGWTFHEARIKPQRPEQRMVDFPAPETFDPVKDIDRSIFRPGKSWGVPSRAYLDTLTAKSPYIAPRGTPEAPPLVVGTFRPKCMHGIMPAGCALCLREAKRRRQSAVA